MPTVHHLNNSRSQRILWLLEELGADYDIKRYERDPDTMLAPDDLSEVHPLGKAPVVTDGDHTLAESGAIIEYLVDEYDEDHRLRPARGGEDYQRYRFWMHYAEGSAMPPMLLSLIVNRIETAPVPFFIKPVVKGVAGKIRSGFLDRQLQTNLDYTASWAGLAIASMGIPCLIAGPAVAACDASRLVRDAGVRRAMVASPPTVCHHGLPAGDRVAACLACGQPNLEPNMVSTTIKTIRYDTIRYDGRDWSKLRDILLEYRYSRLQYSLEYRYSRLQDMS